MNRTDGFSEYSRRSFLVLSGTGAFAFLAGCTEEGGDGGEIDIVETNQVDLRNDQFRPQNIVVDKNSQVTWSNRDDKRHTVTNATDNWDLDRTLQGGDKVSYTFTQSGVYDVYCKLHGYQDMRGMSMRIGVDTDIENPVGGGVSDSDGY